MNIERYRALVDLIVLNRDEELIKEKANEFNNYVNLFPFLLDEEDDRPTQEELENLPIKGIPIPAESQDIE